MVTVTGQAMVLPFLEGMEPVRRENTAVVETLAIRSDRAIGVESLKVGKGPGF